MASLYVEWDRAVEAEPYLTAAARSNDVDPALALADYYLALGRADKARETLEKVIKTKAGFAPASIRLAVIEYVAGNKTNGHRLLDEAIKKEPKNALALAMKARLLLTDNRVEDALTTAKAAVSADPRSPEAQIVLGRVHLARREINDARNAFNEALRLGPQSIEAQLELARLHLNSGEVVTALDYAQQGLKARPNSLEAMLLVVQAYAARIDDLPKAEAALNDVAAKFPNAPQVYTMRGNLAMARKDSNAARRAWEHAVKLDPANVDALGGLVTLLITAKKPADARALVDAHIKDRPNNPGLILLGAKVRLVISDTRGAEEMLKHVLQLDPSTLQAYVLIGQIYVSQHRIQDAKRDFAEVIRQVPESVEAHTMMGLLAAADHDIDGAIGWYEKAVRLNERAAVAANNLAWLHVTRNDNLDAAMKLAESAAREMPRQPEFHDTLGWIYYKKQQTTLAIGALQKAVELDPANATYHYHLGLTYAMEGSDPKARRELQQALKLDPQFPEAAELNKTLSKLVY
jgi:tetratricopeptide (TPR) repeat protein